MRHPSSVMEYMTVGSHSTSSDQSLTAAGAQMRALGIRNLPVVDAGVLSGVLSERDVTLAESLLHSGFGQLAVGDVMSGDLYPVTPSTPLAHVVRTMARHGYGCAVVMEQGGVIGIFSNADALRAFSALIDEQRESRESLGAEELRAMIFSEHAHVKALLARARVAARQLLVAPLPELALRRAHLYARHLVSAVNAHLELEDRALAPVLTELTGFGKERAQQLVDEHTRQLRQTASLALALDDPHLSASRLGERLERLMSNLALDLVREEELLLNLTLLRDDSTEFDAG